MDAVPLKECLTLGLKLRMNAVHACLLQLISWSAPLVESSLPGRLLGKNSVDTGVPYMTTRLLLGCHVWLVLNAVTTIELHAGLPRRGTTTRRLLQVLIPLVLKLLGPGLEYPRWYSTRTPWR